MDLVQRRTALKLLGATFGGIAAQFAGMVPEVFAGGGTTPNADVGWRDLTPEELRDAARAALGTDDGRVLAAHAASRGFVLDANGARGVAIRVDATAGSFVLVPFASNDGRTAQLVYATATGRAPAIALAIVDARARGVTRATGFAVERGIVRATDTTTIRGDEITVTDDRTGSTRTVPVPRLRPAPADRAPAVNVINFAAVAAADSCSDCETAFDFLYGLGCTITSAIACLLCTFLTGPAGFICAIVCGIFWFLICYLGIQLNRCSFCRYMNYCYAC